MAFSHPTSILTLLLLSSLSLGCSSIAKSVGARAPQAEAVNDSAAVSKRGRSKRRKIIKTADLVVSVDTPSDHVKAVEKLITDSGGYVEQSSSSDESKVYLRCRVPANKLDLLLNTVSQIGTVERRSVYARDVTDQYYDLKTRLANSKALRERYRQILKKAKDVTDMLAVEKELNRVQGQIESMQGQFDSLRSRVDLSALSITLEKRQILGPLGYLGYGFWWGFSKLFVLSD